MAVFESLSDTFQQAINYSRNVYNLYQHRSTFPHACISRTEFIHVLIAMPCDKEHFRMNFRRLLCFSLIFCFPSLPSNELLCHFLVNMIQAHDKQWRENFNLWRTVQSLISLRCILYSTLRALATEYNNIERRRAKKNCKTTMGAVKIYCR